MMVIHEVQVVFHLMLPRKILRPEMEVKTVAVSRSPKPQSGERD